MKKLITILALLPALAYGQTWTQPMIDASAADFCGTDTSLFGLLIEYPDTVFSYNYGTWKRLAGDTTLTPDSMLAIFTDTILLGNYVLMPAEPKRFTSP